MAYLRVLGLVQRHSSRSANQSCIFVMFGFASLVGACFLATMVGCDNDGSSASGAPDGSALVGPPTQQQFVDSIPGLVADDDQHVKSLQQNPLNVIDANRTLADLETGDKPWLFQVAEVGAEQTQTHYDPPSDFAKAAAKLTGNIAFGTTVIDYDYFTVRLFYRGHDAMLYVISKDAGLDYDKWKTNCATFRVGDCVEYWGRVSLHPGGSITLSAYHGWCKKQGS